MAKAKIATPSASSKLLVVLLIVVSIAFIIGMGARTFGLIVTQGDSLIDKSTYQSVTIVDGSVYYGSIADIGAEYLVLKNAHIDTDESNAVALEPIWAGASEPSGSLNINRSQVLLWTNLDANGKVAETISINAGGNGE